MDASDARGLCRQCGNECQPWAMVPMARVVATLPAQVLAAHPALADYPALCPACVADLRLEQLRLRLDEENAALTAERKAIHDGADLFDLMKADFNTAIDKRRTVGEKVSDAVTGFVGSWAFIIAQFVVIGFWISLNTYLLIWRPFDPYPFIFLNLLLSWAAALQVPLIMMSQNRQDARDRLRSHHDFQVNLLAELEVRHLHRKLDQLLIEHWQRRVDLEQQELSLGQQQTAMRRQQEAEDDGEAT